MELSALGPAKVADLLDRIGSTLSVPAAEQFHSYIRSGLDSISTTSLIRGDVTIDRYTRIIKKALKDLDDYLATRGEVMPWAELMFVSLDVLKNTLSCERKYQDKPKADIPPSKASTTASSRKTALSPGKNPRQGNAKKKGVINEAAQTPVPTDTEVVGSIKKVVIQELHSPRPLYDRIGQRHVSCKTVGCTFCATMYKSLHLSPCARFGHQACTSVGWFPHVGHTMWKVLRKTHDAGGAFVSKTTPPKSDEIPCLGEVAPLDKTLKRMRLDPSLSWADQMDAQELSIQG